MVIARLFGSRPRAVGQPDVAAAIVLAVLISTCAWLELDTESTLLLVVTAAALAAVPYLPVPDAATDGEAPRLTRAGLLRSLPIAALVCAPTAILLVGTLREEFPFSGDHIHHLQMGLLSHHFWKQQIPWLALFAAGAWLLRRAGLRPWALIAFAVLVAWSFTDASPLSASRYPASSYLLDLPLQIVSHMMVWSAPLDAHRITTALSLVAWLFVLRPLALRRWPDAGILPFALFYFWQQDVVYYDTTSYLEPWSIVFVLTAIELLASDRPSRSWLPVLLVGVGAGFKEQAVLVLPFVGLASLATIPRTRRAWGAAALNGVLAILPFACWYQAVRPLSPFARNSAGLASWPELVSSHRLRVFGWRLHEQFGATGLVMLAATLVVAIVLAIRVPRRRWLTLCLLAAAFTQVAFFYTDRVSMPWTGYPRFHLYAIALIGFAAWMPTPGVRIPTAIVAAAIALAQLPTLAPTVALAARPDPARNYFEHSDAPIYFPIKSLVLEARRDGALKPGTPIAVRPIATEVYGPMELVYPTLWQFPFVGGVTDCRCGPGHEALLVRLPYPARLRAKAADQPLSPEDRACLADVDATYAKIFRRDLDGRPTGVLGVGCKVP